MIRALFWLVAAAMPAVAQVERLPLPVAGPPGAQVFEAGGPTAAILTGLLVPASGPLTSWAPVFRTLGADGRLTAEQPGAWNGPLPSRWVKLSRADSVVAGMRVLVRTGPGPLQTRQIQVFWRLWRDGEAHGAIVESPVYGQAAADRDTVRIVELTVPDHAVAVGLYGELSAGGVVQTSFLVRIPTSPAEASPSPFSGPRSPEAPRTQPLAKPAPPVISSPDVPAVPFPETPRLTPLPNAP
jgi:hypothetical protein